MTLIGECADCGADAPLRFKPIKPIGDQSRPTVCARCHDLRQEIAAEHTRDIDPRRDPS